MIVVLFTIISILYSTEGCDPPFEDIEGFCLYFNPDVAVDSYEAAAGLCTERGATLATIKSGEKNRAIIENQIAGNVDGLRRVLLSATLNELGLFEWIDGDLVRDWFQGWDQGQPSGNGECMGFSMDQNLYWDDFPCENYTASGAFISFICEITNTINTTTTTDAPGTTTVPGNTTTTSTTTTMMPTTTPPGCPEEFEELGLGCYHLSAQYYTWFGGNEYCGNLSGSHMAFVTSANEQGTIEMFLNGTSINIYIGAFDQFNNDTLYWNDGTAVDDGYTNYYEPDVNGGDQNALYMSAARNWRWADAQPVNEYPILCEYEL